MRNSNFLVAAIGVVVSHPWSIQVAKTTHEAINKLEILLYNKAATILKNKKLVDLKYFRERRRERESEPFHQF